MREQDNYWARRLASGRLSRRRFVGGAAVMGTGAAAFGLVGCGDDDDAAATPTPGDSNGATPTPGDQATPTPGDQTEQQRGGTIRSTSADNTWDTFDADRTRFGPMGTVLSLANQGVVGWSNYAEALIEGYFAEGWEQPDDRTFVF